MFGSVTSWLQSGEEMVNGLAEKAGFGLPESSNTAADGSSEAKAAQDAPPADAPWLAAPATWADSVPEWRALVLGTLRDENTYLIGPERLLATESVATKLRDGFPSLQLPAAPKDYDVETKPWLPVLLDIPNLEELRYRLVPGLVSDENFWVNAVWRLKALACTASAVDGLQLLRVINTEPSAPPEDADAPRARNVGIFDNAAMFQEIEADVMQHRDAHDWAATKRDTAAAEVASCKSNLQLLRNLMSARDVEQLELADSVRESVEFHKTKLASHMADIDAAPADRVALCPALVPPEGEVYASLVELNTEAQSVLREFPAWRKEVQDADASPSSTRAAPTSSSPVAMNPAAPVATGSSVAAGAAASDTAFSASVPWDDDDDDM